VVIHVTFCYAYINREPLCRTCSHTVKRIYTALVAMKTCFRTRPALSRSAGFTTTATARDCARWPVSTSDTDLACVSVGKHSVGLMYYCDRPFIYRVCHKKDLSWKFETRVCDDVERCSIYQTVQYFIWNKIFAWILSKLNILCTGHVI